MELPGKICALNLHSHWASGAGVLGWLTNDSVYPAGLKAILVKQDENTLGCAWPHVLYKDIVLGKNILYFNRFIYSSILYVYEYFTCMYECAPCACLLPTQVRRLWISWKETYSCCGTPYGYWELSPNHLQEQQVLFTVDLSFHSFGEVSYISTHKSWK